MFLSNMIENVLFLIIIYDIEADLIDICEEEVLKFD